LRRRAWLAAVVLVAVPALAAREDAAKPKPDDVQQAEEAWENGDRVRAAALAKKIEQGNAEGERSARVAILLARCSSDPEEALERWEQVLALEPEGQVAAEARWSRAQAATALGLHSQAIEEYAVLARDHKSHFDRGRALLGKGLAELQSGEPADALETLGLAARLAKRREDTIAAELALASATYQLGNVREALRRYEKFERDHSDDERARWAAWRQVLCLRLLGREPDAAEKTERMERDYPGSIEAVLAREEIRMGRKAPDEAKAGKTKDGEAATGEAGDDEKDAEEKDRGVKDGDAKDAKKTDAGKKKEVDEAPRKKP